MADDTPKFRYGAGLAAEIEAKWQRAWDERDVYRAANPGEAGFDPGAPKLYVLDMFPYPSGAGLHVGHPLGYIATDIYARYHRMRGFNVLHAMGFDAFGLPAEQYAIDTGTHPAVTTEKNIATFRRQLARLGLGHERRRSVSTTDVAFYKWTQWIFLQIYNAWYDAAAGKARPISELEAEYESGERAVPATSKPWARLSAAERGALLDAHRLAYLADVDVNWCPALGTVLANEEVTADGRSERGNHPVFKRPLRQWMMRITSYADRLLGDLELVKWPEPIKMMQRNWIGRSEGAHIDFECGNRRVRVFTTRPDTAYGATYMVLAPEHPLVDQLAGEKWGTTVPESWKGKLEGMSDTPASPRDAVAAYRKAVGARSDQERQAETKEKTGVFIGAYAINPMSGARVPVFIADYVLMGYGTGAIMAVPAHDERDFEFAAQFGLPIRDVVYPMPVVAIDYFVRQATEVETQGDSWFGMLADFLGLVTSRDAGIERFGEMLAQVRANPRPMTGDDSLRTDAQIAALRGAAPKLIGERRGTTRATWLEAVAELGAGSFAELRERFLSARYYEAMGDAYTGPGVAVNSGVLNGLHTPEAKARAATLVEEKGVGKKAVTFKLRDWLFSRQRYWGEPFPIVYAEDDARGESPIALPEGELPVELPEIDDFRPVASSDPTAAPQPPLGRAKQWSRVAVDVGEGARVYRRELNTMPQWAGSCWYYLRYLDPQNDGAFVGTEVERYWMHSAKASGGAHAGGVDLYVGGAEHAVLHLLYARFWHKVLFDLGHASTPEPFGRLFNQGYIQAPAFTDERGAYVEASKVVEVSAGKFEFEGKAVRREFGKMGKSLKNVVTPDDVCEEYGADTMRLYEMYMGPLEQSKPWNPRDIVGVHRFLQRAWRLVVDEESGDLRVSEERCDAAVRRALHRTIDGVRKDYEALSFNTAIAKLIELTNLLSKTLGEKATPREAAEALVLMLSPLTPHFAEELWSRLRSTSGGTVTREAFPLAEPALLVDETVELPVQIQGKVRGRITVAAGASEESVREAALADEKVRQAIGEKTVQKVIVVPGRMVNVVIG
jgi:leucyl-tRNA synthetase